jgi:hypothetical protein
MANATLVKKFSTTITCPQFSNPYTTLRTAWTPTNVPASRSSDAPMYTIALEMYLHDANRYPVNHYAMTMKRAMNVLAAMNVERALHHLRSNQPTRTPWTYSITIVGNWHCSELEYCIHILTTTWTWWGIINNHHMKDCTNLDWLDAKAQSLMPKCTSFDFMYCWIAQ